MIQASCPSLKEPLRCEDGGDRFIIIHLMVNLFNYQTEVIGDNQFLNSYIKNENQFYGYDIDKYYEF